jgi:hypothetical protein
VRSNQLSYRPEAKGHHVRRNQPRNQAKIPNRPGARDKPACEPQLQPLQI